MTVIPATLLQECQSPNISDCFYLFIRAHRSVNMSFHLGISTTKIVHWSLKTTKSGHR